MLNGFLITQLIWNKRQLNNKFSSEKRVISRVPQGSIDEHFCFNFFINVLIFFITTFLSNYTDGNSLYYTSKDLEQVKSILVIYFRTLTEWFYENFMILNPNKCHYMCIGKNTESDISKFQNMCLENSKVEEILGITSLLDKQAYFFVVLLKASTKKLVKS